MFSFTLAKLLEHLSHPKDFINHEQFFQYHGIVLTFLWLVASLIAIVLKRVHVYAHAFLFTIIDILTLYFITGAWVRVLPTLNQYKQWSFLKQLHVFGGTIFFLIMIWQHLLGAQVQASDIKKSRFHIFLGWVTNNIAKIIAYTGWIFGQSHDKQWMAKYVLIASVILFVLSTGSLIKKMRKGSSKFKGKQQ